MSLGLKMRAAEVGMVFWKKLRSSTFMARFTGGANMSLVASVADIGLCALNGCRVPWRGFCRGRELLLFLVRNDALRRQS